MITNFKIFENENEPRIGDFLICTERDWRHAPHLLQMKIFLERHIGCIINLESTLNKKTYTIRFDVGVIPPINLKRFFKIENPNGVVQDIYYHREPDAYNQFYYTYKIKPEDILFFSRDKKLVYEFIEENVARDKFGL